MDTVPVLDVSRQSPPDAWLEAECAGSGESFFQPSQSDAQPSPRLLPQLGCEEESEIDAMNEFTYIESLAARSAPVRPKKTDFSSTAIQPSPRVTLQRPHTLPRAAGAYAASTASSDAKVVSCVSLRAIPLQPISLLHNHPWYAMLSFGSNIQNTCELQLARRSTQSSQSRRITCSHLQLPS